MHWQGGLQQDRDTAAGGPSSSSSSSHTSATSLHQHQHQQQQQQQQQYQGLCCRTLHLLLLQLGVCGVLVLAGCPAKAGLRRQSIQQQQQQRQKTLKVTHQTMNTAQAALTL
jgi:hypothetical protein